MLHEVKDTRAEYIALLEKTQEVVQDGASPSAMVIQVHRVDGTVTTVHKRSEGAPVFAILGGLDLLKQFFLKLIAPL